jgi:hypothetical protein
MKVMKSGATTWAVLILLSAVARLGGAQSTLENSGLAQETQVRGYWTDPPTGLMWAGKDNGRDVTWKNAVKYCRNLRLAGDSDWRLASLGELEGLYDKDANAPGLMGPSGKGHTATWHVKGDLFLTGNQWSSTQKIDGRGHPSGWVWRFDFNEGRSFDGDEVTFHTNKRAPCVRRAENYDGFFTNDTTFPGLHGSYLAYLQSWD